METQEAGLEDYAIIGDCRSAALISRQGSIDWLCWPRFDSPSLFASLLDQEKGGYFAIRPVKPFFTRRRYVGDTNVLETTFFTEQGVFQLTDLMPVDSEENKHKKLWAAHQILRKLECVEGEVEIELICDPRPNYGRDTCRMEDRGALGLYFEFKGSAFILRSDIPLRIAKAGDHAHLSLTLTAGERRYVCAVFSEHGPAFIPPLGDEAERRITATLNWWNNWASRCTYIGPYRQAVIRSALVLKLMTYAPSGAVIAAPTTSLPEWPGGSRNWDYRYCWLRDASLTLRVLFDLGYHEEADAFTSWLLHSTRLTWPQLQTIYDVHGETRLDEIELDHLSGYANSRPVRVGNAASNQLQLDIYGEVVDAVYGFVRHGRQLSSSTARLLVGFGKSVCRSWRKPDDGIWEIRSGPQHHTYSKAMCWITLDRLIRLHNEKHVKVPIDLFTAEYNALRYEIDTRGYNKRLGSYVSTFDGDDLDASLLLLARYGYIDPKSERANSTRKAVLKHLGHNGLVYRYRGENDGLSGDEGAFGICSFWAVGDYALAGEIDEGEILFKRVLSYANDLGLYAEEINPDNRAALGNFPQAFTHIGLIDAALLLEEAKQQDNKVTPSMENTP